MIRDHCQHVADFYRFRDVLNWDNYMRDALGVERLSTDELEERYKASLVERLDLLAERLNEV